MTQAFKQGMMDKLAQTSLGGMAVKPTPPIRHTFPATGLYSREVSGDAIDTQLTRPDTPYSRIYNDNPESHVANVDKLPGADFARRMQAVQRSEDAGVPAVLASHTDSAAKVPSLLNPDDAAPARSIGDKLQGFWNSDDKMGIIKNWAKNNKTPLMYGGAALAGGAGLLALYKSYQAQKEREEEDRIMRRRMMFKGASDSFIAGAMSKLAQATPSTKLPPVAKAPITARTPAQAAATVAKLGPKTRASVMKVPEVAKTVAKAK